VSHIVGNIVGDIDLRYTPGGMAVASFTVAENRREKVKGNFEDVSHFFDVVVKFEQAEQVTESLQKGVRVVCVGEFTQRRWETKEGEKRSKIEFLAEEVAPSLRYATAVVTKKDRPSKKVSEQYSDERPF
jgi:single-strand DNA-binding protein